MGSKNDYKKGQREAKLALKSYRTLHSGIMGTIDLKIRKFKRTFRSRIKGSYPLILEFKDKAWGASE